MKITNSTDKKVEAKWKLGDYFLTSGQLRRIGHMKGRGYFIVVIDSADSADESYKAFRPTVDELVSYFSKNFEMTRVVIKEIIVEEV